jgi:hypothetical protein
MEPSERGIQFVITCALSAVRFRSVSVLAWS